MYTIGQVSKLFGLPVSTLRYYDKEGLFPGIHRSSGIRQFDDKEIEAIRVIECLKKSGLEIKDIKQLEAEIEQMNRILDMLKFKCWYYGEAIRDGNEERLSAMKPEDMPEEIRQAYENAHQ